MDTSLGFRYRGRLCGGPPTMADFVAASAATYHKGDLVATPSAGEAEIAATDGKLYLGIVNETKVCTGVATTGTKIEVIYDDDSIFGVYDPNARLIGAHLDLAGATGAMTVAGDANHDLMVIANSAADEETQVIFSHGAHFINVTVT